MATAKIIDLLAQIEERVEDVAPPDEIDFDVAKSFLTAEVIDYDPSK
jgi:hypothetical protein